MKISNRFAVESPVDEVWALFDQLDRVVPCMPGASYGGQEDGGHHVAMKVKLGAIVSNFQGTVNFIERDEAAHRAVMRGAAKDSGGKGSAVALIETRLTDAGAGRTQVDVTTELSMTGRLAQFGGPVVTDVAQRLVQQFTDNLHKTLQADASRSSATSCMPTEAGAPGIAEEAATSAARPALAAPAGSAPMPGAEVAPLDLGAVVGQSLLHNFGRYALVLVVGFALGWLAARHGWRA